MGAIEFDWDLANERHLARHGVAPAEFEELILSEPLYLEYQVKGNEERYKVLGKTKAGRVLIGIWTRGKEGCVPSPPMPPAAFTGNFYRESCE